MLKESPEAAPALLKTDFSKQDLPKLNHDLVKWASTLSATSRDWWEHFVESLEEISETQRCEFHAIFELKNDVQRPEDQTQGLENAEINMQL